MPQKLQLKLPDMPNKLTKNNLETSSKLPRTAKTVPLKNEAMQKQEFEKFFHLISHELKSPINATIGLIGLMKDTKDMELLKFQINMMSSKIHELSNTINELIDFSMNFNASASLVEVNCVEMVEDIVAQINQLDNYEHNIQIDVSENAQSKFVTDRLRCRIILSNLIMNAFKYKDVSKPKNELQILINSTEKEVIITIADNGIGISTDDQAKIFSMFYRVSENISGQGLGLYLTKDAVSKIGGQISLESEVGKGSTFTVILPNKINSIH